MKWPVWILLLPAAGLLAWIGWRSGRPTYVAPTPEEVRVHQPAPAALSGAPPGGSVVRSFEVEGMCCLGCTGKLHAALSAVPGVSQAAVDFDGASASVHVEGDVPVDRLLAALNFGKYAARPLQ